MVDQSPEPSQNPQPMPGQAPRQSLRLELLLFVLLFGSFAWFGHSNPGWNVNSRLALTTAWATTGRPHVEDFVGRLQTQDLAQYDGHLYSDKSIGTSLLGIPAALAVSGVESLRSQPFSVRAYTYLITLGSVVPTGALAGVLLMRWLTMIWPGVSRRAAAFLAAGVMLGSMLFLYSTLFMSYAPATMFLLATLIAIEATIRRVRHGAQRVSILKMAAVAGLCGGLTILCEYIYAAAVGLSGLYLLFQCGRRLLIPTALLYGAGCVIGNLPFIIYSTTIFGRPSIPYEFHLVPEFRFAMSLGFMGATWPPSPAALWLITFHPFRGLFFYSPMLFMGLVGLAAMLTRAGLRPLGWLCAACTTFYLGFNACYYMWWGGWSFAPRHLAPAVPFLAAGLGPWTARSWSRWVLALAAIYGTLIHLLVNATEPQTPDGGWQMALLRPSLKDYAYPNTFAVHTWPRVIAGALDWNPAQAAGLTGLYSLLPLLLFWAIMVWLIGVSPKKPLATSHN